ncbi:BTAD domain-containing putative transcriptional regulator [Streptomyces sp. NBS 14/10]|uniref:AfsR/SARP family transcriptional regulator n=1 Tax=Streptomyces sp. NBS 14/10 TaxID=1945643 RepID=UPI00211B58AE|nr:BTAD domain-containing putative transcriptional regulator [Streptomyces sp. NBS 14/10]KAK1180591.1 BTAD domain-containing putative transcriptional regulator [Streptomyces sp. NBS 14/10]
MPIEFRVLGDVGAYVDGAALDLGHAQQRSVLAVLLAEARRTVSADQLVDRIWGEGTPQRAKGTLYSYLSRLRGVLAVAEDECRIARRPGGYALLVDPDSVDLHRFRALVERARAADEASVAAPLFDQALGQWRGDFGASCDTPWFGSVREGLRQERLAALLDRYDTLLLLGRHGALLAELFTLVEEQPLNERLTGHIMLALYRGGRVAEALTRYDAFRRRLAEELGVDPGPQLRQLHQQILTADPALTPAPTPAASPQAARHPVPAHLPAPPPRFTGRTHELDRLARLLEGRAGAEDPMAIVAITGPGGIGKTWLALHWAHRHLRDFPDGQLYVNLRGFDPSAEPVPVAAAIRGLLDALGADPAAIPSDVEGQAGLYRSLVAGKRLLVLLDNARDSDQVRPLLPGSPTCTALITSRHRLTGLAATHGIRALGLDVLSETEARTLLTRHLGDHRVADEPAAVHTLLDHCGGLPLAVSILSARAAAHPDLPLSALAEEVEEAATRLDALDTGDVAADLRAVFSSSYRALAADAAKTLSLLGLAPGPDISVPAAASLTGLPAPRVRDHLRTLQAAHLLQQHTPHRHRMHDLVRLYAAEQAETLPTDHRQSARHRLLDFCLHSACAAAELLDPHGDRIPRPDPRPGVTPEAFADEEDALRWFTAEHPFLLGAMDLARASGFDSHVWMLAQALEPFFDYRGHWRDWADTQHTALLAAQRLGELTWQADAHRGLGAVYTQIKRLDHGHTHYQHALDLYGRAGERLGQAHAYRGLSWVFVEQDRLREALVHNERALALYREADHRTGQAKSLNNAGWLHAMLGEYEHSLDYCTEAVELNQKSGNRHAEAGAWDSLGYAHHHLGGYADAVNCYQRALDLVRGFGDRCGEVEILIHLGDSHGARNAPELARSVWQQALRIADEIDHTAADELRKKLVSHSP